MRPLLSFLTVFLASILGRLQLSLAAPNHSLSPRNPKLKDAVSPPRNWIDLGRAPSTHSILLRIALPQARFSELERQLYEMSDPSHARYGQHLMKEQVEELVRPDQRSVEAVDAWLVEYGIIGDEAVQRSQAGDWVTILVPVAVAEVMLDTEFHLWKNTKDGDDGDTLIRTTHYSLPEHLHAHIELVQPTTYFGRPKAMSATFHLDALGLIDLNISISGNNNNNPSPPPPSNGPSPPFTDPVLHTNCTKVTTVSCLLQMYNASWYQTAAADKNAIGVTGYLGQFASQADLQSFYKVERPDAVNSTFNTVLVNGGQNDQTNPGLEANLDTQFAFGLTFPTQRTFFSTGGSPPFIQDAQTPTDTNEPYDDWLQFVLKMRDGTVPQTISTSYSDDEQTVPENYAVRVCKEFAALGSRGSSIIFSSGDSGVGGGNPQQCISNDGQNQARFIPHFPASCPYVTTVGGTSGFPEVAAPFSGGGFSNYFARPSYQDAAVQAYLDQNNPSAQYQGLFNPYAYPDVSARSTHFLIWFRGRSGLISGTSASAPTFAGIVALLNDANIAAGKPSLGFLNPMLYSIGVGGLNDVTQGNNPGCGTPGFNASAGWDPVTGLGTPNFGELKDILSSYNPPPPTLLNGLLGLLNLNNILASISLKLL